MDFFHEENQQTNLAWVFCRKAGHIPLSLLRYSNGLCLVKILNEIPHIRTSFPDKSIWEGLVPLFDLSLFLPKSSHKQPVP